MKAENRRATRGDIPNPDPAAVLPRNIRKYDL
jgi:hypothetical protein